ncbi:hypothetical protein [Chelativorans sp. AA-79]|uniref:hypothetical protein n=1 Tax=Chelativorans sp. AA-79 TaxID=3028735 RepID=UPI0023F788F5|nr:hypothetical protein [Chelativorans sp. AA-79]WEX08449.1 hypothetical protein PVE73_20600 [Chelativorans sp. AA-79]
MIALACRSANDWRSPVQSATPWAMEGSQPSWFATLRRDRGLFALVSALAILLGLLQPIAAAQNARFNDLLVICNTSASPAAPADHGKRTPDCPLCPTGHLCGTKAAPAVPAQIPALVPLAVLPGQRLSGPATAALPGLSDEAPPSIRAPPLSA